MSNTLIKYPLDLTGANTNNLVVSEDHSLVAAPNRAFVPDYGPFFARSLVVRAMPSGTPLTPDVQFKACQMFTDATVMTGEEICTVVVITDDTLGSDFQIDYQVLGGDYSASVDSIQQMIDTLQIDNRSVSWGQLLGKPEQFPPAPHLHDLGDLYGFEYLIVELEAIRRAILQGDEASHQAIFDYINHQDGLLSDRLDADELILTGHVADRNNPHVVTKAQIGLGSVDNYATASTAQAQAGTATNLFVTPAGVKAALTAQIGNALTNHINDHNNPHVVTAAQVGLGNVPNYAAASVSQAQAGTSTTTLMTPSLTASAITTQALVPLTNHINDSTNPHSVTKAQVGLGSVLNYGVATTTDAQTGSSNVLYMTPALVKAAVTYQVGNTLAAHIADHGNPHQVTAAQVGLGNVNNTSDAAKPISTATQNALNGKANSSHTHAIADVTGLQAALNGKFNTGGGTISGAVSMNSTLTVAGKIYGNGGFKYSDITLKTNLQRHQVRPLWRSLPMWNWNMIRDGSHGSGPIAQDVKAVAPDLVDQCFSELDGNRLVLSVNQGDLAVESAFAAGMQADRAIEILKVLWRRVMGVDTPLPALPVM